MREKPEADSDSTGEWRARTGTHQEIDTQKLRVFDGMPSGEEAFTEPVPGSDPYNRASTGLRVLSGKSARRSLDDMRKLSETIKKSRNPRQ